MQAKGERPQIIGAVQQDYLQKNGHVRQGIKSLSMNQEIRKQLLNLPVFSLKCDRVKIILYTFMHICAYHFNYYFHKSIF